MHVFDDKCKMSKAFDDVSRIRLEILYFWINIGKKISLIYAQCVHSIKKKTNLQSVYTGLASSCVSDSSIQLFPRPFHEDVSQRTQLDSPYSVSSSCLKLLCSCFSFFPFQFKNCATSY